MLTPVDAASLRAVIYVHVTRMKELIFVLLQILEQLKCASSKLPCIAYSIATKGSMHIHVATFTHVTIRVAIGFFIERNK